MTGAAEVASPSPAKSLRGRLTTVSSVATTPETRPGTSHTRFGDSFFQSLFEFKRSKEEYDEVAKDVQSRDAPAADELMGGRQSFNTREEKNLNQRSLEGTTPQSYDHLAEVARLAMPALASVLREVLVKAGVDPEEECLLEPHANVPLESQPTSPSSPRKVLKTRLLLPGLKARERSEEKVRDDYGGNWAKLFDMCRASVILKSMPDLVKVWRMIEDHELCKIHKVKNRIQEPLFSGYRDVLLICEVHVSGTEYEVTHLCEVQLHLEDVIALKKNSHTNYVFFRTYFKGKGTTADQRLEDLLQVANKGATSIDEVVEVALESTDLDHIERVVKLLVLVARYNDASSLAERQLQLAEESKPGKALQCMNMLANLLKFQGRFAEATPLYRRAYQEYCENLGKKHMYSLMCANNLALALRAQNQLAEAEPLLRSVLEGYYEKKGAKQETMEVANNLAIVLMSQGNFMEAEPLYRWAYKVYKKKLGEDHRSVITAAHNLGTLLKDLGRLDEAQPLFQKALDGFEREFGPDHPDTLATVNILASVNKDLGRFQESEQLYRRVRDGWEAALGPDHPDTARGANNLATVLKKMGRLEEAEKLYIEAIASWEHSLGEDHPDTLSAVNNLATLLDEADRHRESEHMLLRAFAGRERALGPEHPDTLQSANNLGVHYENTGRPEKAEPMYRQVWECRLSMLGKEHPDTLTSAVSLGWLLMDGAQNAKSPEAAAEQLQDAEEILQPAHDARLRVLGPQHPKTHQSADLLEQLQERLESVRRSTSTASGTPGAETVGRCTSAASGRPDSAGLSRTGSLPQIGTPGSASRGRPPSGGGSRPSSRGGGSRPSSRGGLAASSSLPSIGARGSAAQ